jgi:hypothetical protein
LCRLPLLWLVTCTAARCGGVVGVVRGYRFAQPTAIDRHRVAMRGWLGAVACDRGVEGVVPLACWRERGRVGGLMQGGRGWPPLPPCTLLPCWGGCGLLDWKGSRADRGAGRAVERRRGHRRSDVMSPAIVTRHFRHPSLPAVATTLR